MSLPRHIKTPSRGLQSVCDVFNKLYPIGTAVVVSRDNGTELETVTRSGAWVMGTHSAVIQVKGISGAYALTRVRVKTEEAASA